MEDGLDLTELLGRAQAGDAGAAEAVFRATYDELRYIAHVRLGGGRRNTFLDTTALVHEWFVRFAKSHRLRIGDRRHFMRYAARAMRTIIVDFARERSAARRGGGAPEFPLLETEAVPPQGGTNILFGIAGRGGALFVTDLQLSAVLAIDLSHGTMSTLAGGAPGDVDGPGADARFFFPEGITACRQDLFVSDSGNEKIRKIASDGTVTTYTGSTSGITFQDGPLEEARFSAPDGLACETDGKLFVADFGNRRIRMITPSSIVTTLAGSLPSGIVDGDQSTARFGAPVSIAVDATGVLYIGDGSRLRTLTWE